MKGTRLLAPASTDGGRINGSTERKSSAGKSSWDTAGVQETPADFGTSTLYRPTVTKHVITHKIITNEQKLRQCTPYLL
jgi:hypothetical protein